MKYFLLVSYVIGTIAVAPAPTEGLLIGTPDSKKTHLFPKRGGFVAVRRKRVPPSSRFRLSSATSDRCVSNNSKKNTLASSTSVISTTTTRTGIQKNKRKLKLAVSFVYFCNMFAIALPVVLLPVLASERLGPGVSTAAFCASVASVSSLGGAAGKLFNGFICQRAGGRVSSVTYLACMSLATFGLSTMSSNVGVVLGFMEFFCSMQWTACSVILANHYENDPAGLSGAISSLALASSLGVVACKMLGSVLLQYMSWRQVAQFGSLLALTGSLVMKSVVSEHPSQDVKRPPKQELSLKNIVGSVRAVAGTKVFWLVGLSHGATLTVRNSDKILGAFFQEITSLPRSVCGGLTVSITLGFIHGLISGKSFHSVKSIKAKTAMWSRRYFVAFCAALTLAAMAQMPMSSSTAAVAVSLVSAAMASSVSFQFYQFSAIFSTEYGENKAVCISFLDGMGFFLAFPVWALMGHLVKNLGWSAAWSLMAALIAIGGVLMSRELPAILEKKQQKTA